MDKQLQQKCPIHNKETEFICYQCNILCCSICISQHKYHSFDHIYNIKQSLFSRNNENNTDTQHSYVDNRNNNNNSNDTLHNVQSRIDDIWLIIKSTTESYQSLNHIEDEIQENFKHLHEFLVIEENRLKLPIIDDKEKIKDTIQKDFDELKSLVHIINKSNSQQQQNTSSLQQQTIREEDDCININNLSINNQKINSIDDYKIESIIESIKNSVSLQHFISENKNTLFYNYQDEYKNSEDKDDYSLLQLIQNHNNKYKSNNLVMSSPNVPPLSQPHSPTSFSFIDRSPTPLSRSSSSSISSSSSLGFSSQHIPNSSSMPLSQIIQQQHNYKLIVNQNIINKIKENIPQSIQLVNYNTRYRSNSIASRMMATDGNGEHSMTYIYSVDCNNEAVLFNLTNNEVELLDIRSHGACTFNSMVNIDNENIYTFGGDEYTMRYQRYAIKSKAVDLEGDIIGVEGGKCISACYDFEDHIFLLNGYKRNSTVISQFNIHTMQFERCVEIKDIARTQVLSFFYDGLLYSIGYNTNKIITYNPVNKQVNDYIYSKELANSTGHCHDGNGNIYIHCDDHRFFVINLETKEIRKLKHLDIHFKNYCSMVYHQANQKVGHIYLFGGRHYGNYVYDVQRDKWHSSFKESNSDRRTCGSILFTIKT